MIKTKKKYLIISLLTVIFTAVICAFTIQSPQAVYAATSSLFSGTPRPNIYANPGAVSIYYPTNFYLLDDATQEKIKSGYLVLMRTESIEKYYKLKNEGCSLTVEDKRGNHTESYAPYALNLISESRIKSALSSYCDDFYFYSSNNNMEGKNIGEYLFDAFNKNVFKFAYPADLSKDYYYYFAYFSFSHDIPFVGNCVEKLTMEELGNFSEKFNVSKSIYSYLEASFGDSYTRIELQKALGIYTGNKSMPITVKYRHCAGYRYIREGVFLHIEMTDLVSYKKKKRYQKATAKRPPRGTSIELRPEEIDSRTTFGNWEMDCVVGPSLAVLLVFTERQTRKELIMRLKDRKAKTVVAAIDFLERKFGDKFDKMFKSITVDNGSEFSDVDGLERSFFDDSVCRTKMYYCHPYTSCERGSNERMNRDIRRFFPKGTDFEKVSDTEIIRVERLLNNFPREVLGYSTPQSLYESALANL